MSGIPRDYPGVNQFPQILRASAAGDGAAEFRKDAVGPSFTERAPAPQQPGVDVDRAMHWIASLARPVVGASPDSPAAVQQSNALTILALLVDAQNDVARKRAQINEAIALIENGPPYERMHVAGTLRAAL